MTEQIPTPDVTLTLSNGKQVFMSYGLLNLLARMIGSPEQVAMLYLDMELQSTLLCHALGEVDPAKGTITPAVGTTSLSMEDAEKLTHWIAEHILDFFVRTLGKANNLEKKFLPRLAVFKSSSTGSEVSPSTNLSAGPLAQSQAD